MKPATPVIKGCDEIVFAEDQPEYESLPAIRLEDRYGTVITRWRMTWRERLRCLVRGDVYLTVMTFRRPLQPVLLGTAPPEFETPE